MFGIFYYYLQMSVNSDGWDRKIPIRGCSLKTWQTTMAMLGLQRPEILRVFLSVSSSG